MRVLRKATMVLVTDPASAALDLGGQFPAAGRVLARPVSMCLPDVNQRRLSTPLSETRLREGSKMKVLANTAALLVALSVMGGLILAQRGYQNSWREPSSEQASTMVLSNQAAPQEVVAYKAILK